MIIRTLSTPECTAVAGGQSPCPSRMREGRAALCRSDPLCLRRQPSLCVLHARQEDRMDARQSAGVRSGRRARRGSGMESVVVDGRYEELPDRIGHKLERDHAWSLLSKHADLVGTGRLQAGCTSCVGSFPACVLPDPDRAGVRARSQGLEERSDTHNRHDQHRLVPSASRNRGCI